MRYYDETLSFRTNVDTGDDASTATQPITNSEHVEAEVAGRPDENLRARTVRLQRAVENLQYLSDYDRQLLVRAVAAITLTQVEPGRYRIDLASGSLFVVPALTPGPTSGGRYGGGRVFCTNSAAANAWTPYSGTLGTDDLILIASRQYTGQRGYADGTTFEGASTARSLGANNIEVSLVADPGLGGGPGSISAAITGVPKTRIVITYGTAGTPTTLADLVTFINADRTSQGTFGVADYLRATSTGTTTNAPVPFSDGVVQGAYDAEAHEVTAAQIAAFFDALDASSDPANLLEEGECLAVGYPVGPIESGVASPRAGRRQAIYDLPTDRVGTRTSNTTPSSGWSLFNTGREPEKIPGSIPIGKMLNGEFVFLDGTRLAAGETLYLGESRTTYAALAALTTNASGARRVGYDGGVNWHSDASATTSPGMTAELLDAALDRIVADLARATASQSGARRVGSEALTGTPSAGNGNALSLDTGSLRQALLALLNGTSGGLLVGVNGRVSENGHRMVGARPLQKDYGYAGMPSDGGQFLQTVLPKPTNAMHASAPGGKGGVHQHVFEPLIYENPSDASDYLTQYDLVSYVSATVLYVSTMDSTRMGKVFAHFPLVEQSSLPLPLIYVRLTADPEDAQTWNGFYVLTAYDAGTRQITLRNLNGTFPSFTGMPLAMSVEWFTGSMLGSNAQRVRWTASHINAARPWAVLGAPEVGAVLAEFYTPSGNTGARKSRVYPDRVEMAGNSLFNTATTQRSSGNILLDSDKAVLSGIELSAPVDATANHHHGGNYTQFYPFYAAPAGYTLDTINTTGDTPPYTNLTLTTPASGYAHVGVVFYYRLTLAATVSSGNTSVTLGFYDGSGNVLYQVTHSYTSVGSDTEVFLGQQVVLPLVSGAVRVARVLSINLVPGSCLLEFFVSSVHRVRT